MREPLTVAVTQPPCVSYEVAANALTAAATVRSAGARVVVFPELFLTGYELDAPALDVDDPRLAPIVEACAEAGSLALVGAPVHGNAGGSHIAMLAIDDTRAAVAYRKMWLGAAESNRFTPGDTPGVLEVDGWRLGLAICKDTAISQHARDTAGLGIDAYLAELWNPLRRPRSRMSARGASPATTACGWRWQASPARPAGASPRPPAVRPSGRPTASSSPRQGPSQAPSHARRSVDHESPPPLGGGRRRPVRSGACPLRSLGRQSCS
jgi:hypothetical protein